MKLFRRKPRKFDYAAIRVGNVYVLPPDEDDVRAFNRKRRRELTRRGFVVAGAAAAAGAVAWLLWPARKPGLDPNTLFQINPANADKAWLKDLCRKFRSHPNEEIRFQCARVMSALPKDKDVKRWLWEYIRGDASQRVREMAIVSLVQHEDPGDIPALADHYFRDPALQPTLRQLVEELEYDDLRRAIEQRIDR